MQKNQKPTIVNAIALKYSEGFTKLTLADPGLYELSISCNLKGIGTERADLKLSPCALFGVQRPGNEKKDNISFHFDLDEDSSESPPNLTPSGAITAPRRRCPSASTIFVLI